MTPPRVRVKVCWTPPEEGGRVFVPQVGRYSAVTQFPEDGPNQEVAWSIVIDLDLPSPPAAGRGASFAHARFLFDTAPHERLKPGRTFDLFEGPRKVASVEVLED